MNKHAGLPDAREATDWNKRSKKLIPFLVIVKGTAPLEVEQAGVAELRKICGAKRAPRVGDDITLSYDMATWTHVYGTVKNVSGSLDPNDPFAFVAHVELNDARKMYPLLCALPDWEKLPVKTKTAKEISATLRDLGPLEPLPLPKPEIRGSVKYRKPDITIDVKAEPDTIGGVVPDDIVET